MEVRKTTLLSFLVCIAGILTEIIFRDVFIKSAFGVTLSVLLAVAIIVLAYFFYDGLFSFLAADREMDKKRREEYDEKLYTILNEQVQLEKAIYKEVHALMEKSENTDKAENGSVGGCLKPLEAMEGCLKRLEALEAIWPAAESKEALEKIQGSIQSVLEKQSEPETGLLQNDIRTIIANESELKQSQSEMQSSIRKVVEILSILLSLLREKKSEDKDS